MIMLPFINNLSANCGIEGNRSIEWTHKRKNSHYISMIR
ncbi:hypothetical protein D1AOALGA4SA_11198 [Olavius algarvensis Delta 1 endosymbiont]|nr:hypothetical protein D1AOALGA4SA_11198 [Olavius algarvensis Delta 1 endosymbiont]